MRDRKDFFSDYTAFRMRRCYVPPNVDSSRKASRVHACRSPWLPRDKHAAILEIGCGWGHLLRSVWAAGYRNLTGIDIAESQCAIARGHLPGEVRIACSDAMTFLRDHRTQYDLVLCFFVIEHHSVDEAVDLLKAIKTALKPGGSAVVATDNCATLVGSFMRHIDATHREGYTEYSLFQLLDAAGFVDHRLVNPPLHSTWRFWRFKGGLQLRRRLNHALHLIVYRLAGVMPPTCFDRSLEVQTFLPNDATGNGKMDRH